MAELPSGEDWKEGNENDMSCIYDCFCPNCELSTGITNMLPTKVPYFREIIIMSFACNNCYYKNTEINFGGEIQLKGEKIHFTVTSINDLNRQIIKSDSATVQIPYCDLEIPALTQRGTISTIEGFLKLAANNLDALQNDRLLLGDIDNFHRCRTVIATLRQLSGDPIESETDNDIEESKYADFVPFDIIIDDPAGNSFIENIFAPDNDPNMILTKYFRTPTQDMALGLQPSAQAIADGTLDDTNPAHKNIVNVGPAASSSTTVTTTTTNGSNGSTGETTTTTTTTQKTLPTFNVSKDLSSTENLAIGRKEVITFETPCAHCFRTVETNMCVVDVPHFKEIIIMSMVCEFCGYKSNEIKGGGGIPKYGTTIKLTVVNSDDMSREILKSDTAGIQIPELDLELEEGGLDGVYTTIEGLIQKLYDRLTSANPFGIGDSASKQHLSNDTGNEFSEPAPNHVKYQQFLLKLKNMSTGLLFPFTIIITDPLSNSFIGPIATDAINLALQAERDGNNSCYDTYVDPGMTVTEFPRTFDQNEFLGLNDIKTENYHEPTTATNEDSTLDAQQTNNAATSTDDEEQATQQYYGTDQMEDLPDRIRRVDIRGPDHPHNVGKAPVDDDTTIMGPGSLNFAVPSIGQRGTRQQQEQQHSLQPVSNSTNTAATTDIDDVNTIQQFLRKIELDDTMYQASSSTRETIDVVGTLEKDPNGQVTKKVLKTGAKGIGYYTDIPLLERWNIHSKII